MPQALIFLSKKGGVMVFFPMTQMTFMAESIARFGILLSIGIVAVALLFEALELLQSRAPARSASRLSFVKPTKSGPRQLRPVIRVVPTTKQFQIAVRPKEPKSSILHAG